MGMSLLIIEFFLPMEKVPTATHQQTKVTCKDGKPIHYEPNNLKKARADYLALLSRYVPDKPLDGPLQLTTKFLFAYPKSWPKSKRTTTWKDTKPDNGNANKLLEDVMEELGFYKNDSQIASLIIQHFWSEPSGIYIKLDKL